MTKNILQQIQQTSDQSYKQSQFITRKLIILLNSYLAN